MDSIEERLVVEKSALYEKGSEVSDASVGSGILVSWAEEMEVSTSEDSSVVSTLLVDKISVLEESRIIFEEECSDVITSELDDESCVCNREDKSLVVVPCDEDIRLEEASLLEAVLSVFEDLKESAAEDESS